MNLKGIKLTWLSHATFRIETPAGKIIIIDPWIMGNPACPESEKDVKKVDIMLCTHGHGDHIGDAVTIGKKHSPKVVGIVDEEPYGGMRTVSRGRIFLPVDLTEKLNMAEFSDMRSSLRGHGKTYATLTVRVKDPAKVSEVQDTIKQMGFRTFSVLDATKSLRRFFTVLDLFLGIFGSLALAVATLAIINTLVMAVLERRREIGVMKAIGASDRSVRR